MTYAIVKTGGKQYRVEPGQRLLVERLPAGEGDTVALEPLLFRGDDKVITDGDDLAKVKVEAKVVGHERGPKLRVVKFKPKKGYKRRTGHRQELTRLEVVDVKLTTRSAGKARSAGGAARKPAAKKEPAAKAEAGEAAEKPPAKARKAAAPKPAAKKEPAAKKPPARKPAAKKDKETDDGS